MGLEFTRQTEDAIRAVKALQASSYEQSSLLNSVMIALQTVNSAVIDLQTRVEQLERANGNRQRQAARSN